MKMSENLSGKEIRALSFALGSLTGVCLTALTMTLLSNIKLLLPGLYSGKNQYRGSVPTLARSSSNLGVDESNAIINRIQKSLEIGKTILLQLVRIFLRDLERGLEREGSSIGCVPSYLYKSKNESFQGEYLAFALGGSNYRVALVTLLGKGRSKCIQIKSELPESIKTEDSTTLFDFCADKVKEFYDQEDFDMSKPMKLGFSFSFPLKNTSSKSAILTHWTKGFSVDDAIGKEVAGLLQDALDRKGFNIKVSAILNDSVAIFLASFYTDSSTKIGVVLGTGNNASYAENVRNIPKLKIDKSEAPKYMIINTEWGSWGSDGSILPVTVYDIKVDRSSFNPRMQTYEKMVSGMYLGEIARYVLVDLISTGELFSGVKATKFLIPHSFTVMHMARIERDHSPDLSATRNLLEDFYDIQNASVTDLKLVRKICEMVSMRAARIASVGIAALLTNIKKIGNTGATIAVNGSIFEHYPHFQDRIMDALRELFGIAADEFIITYIADGPVIGAALAVAMENE